MKVLLLSGFLGAGKTTFIKEMAKHINLEFVILENEYADVGVDKDFLNSKENLKVWEMAEGCICCSMKGDFKNSIKRIYQEIEPEYLIIEPTGVGMLSSILENIKEIKDIDIQFLNPLTFIDVTSFEEYIESFKNFFIDNLKNTGKIILTKLQNINFNKKQDIIKKILEINNNIEIISEDYRYFSKEWYEEILNRDFENKVIDKNFSIGTHINLRTFSKENLNLNNMDKLGKFLEELIEGKYGKVYRAKGIVDIGGYWGKFNLVHKNFEMEAIEKATNSKIVIIGNNLDIKKLEDI